MTTTDHAHKLAQFRAKTDSQLHDLLQAKLERGLSAARNHSGNEDAAGVAERAYREVSRLLPLVGGITPVERRRLENRLSELCELLNCPSYCAECIAQAAAML